MRIVRLIPIISVIEKLKNEKILNSNNFDERLMIAYLGKDEVKKISDMGYNIFINSLEKKEMYVSEKFDKGDVSNISISNNYSNSIVIGVIDSGNNLEKPFDKFIIDNQDHREFGGGTHDYEHGSLVSSLIIANDELNPSQADGLGNFKIKHFEVLEKNEKGETSATFNHVINKLEEIIVKNREIKVWNLSFGSNKKPYSRMMSEMGKLLDLLSSKYNIIFVIAAGNERKKYGLESLNAPGDSLNSITVGSSLYEDGIYKFSDYSSFGPILHFEKPEISYFGGPHNKDGSPLVGYYNGRQYFIQGTSFSSPRICRLLAHFIQEGFNISEAKAKVISLAEYVVSPKNRASSFGVINYVVPKLDIYFTTSFFSNKPRILPFDVPQKSEKIVLTNSRIVSPMAKLGEEYSINNFDVKLIVYDKSISQPHKEDLTRVVKRINARSNKYGSETIKRFDHGKYFNTHRNEYSYKEILEAKNELMYSKKVSESNIGTAIFIKKLDLFDTVDLQKQDVSVVMNIFGDNIDIEEFENNNSAIISVEVPV